MPLRWLLALGSIGVAQGQVTFGGDVGTRSELVYRPIHGRGTRGGAGVNPFGGVLPGIAVLAGSTALLWWNEGARLSSSRYTLSLYRLTGSGCPFARAVPFPSRLIGDWIVGSRDSAGRTARTDHMLAHARRTLTSVNAAVPIDSQLGDEGEGQLVHVSGPLSSSGVADALFGDVARPHALRLQRRVETFEWAERKHARETRVSDSHVRRTTDYSYEARWRTQHQQSSHFADGGRRHHNPTPRLPPGVFTETATDAALPNGLAVPSELVEQLDGFKPVPLSLPGAGAASASRDPLAETPVSLSPRDDAFVAPVVDSTGGGGAAHAIYLPAGGANADGDGRYAVYQAREAERGRPPRLAYAPPPSPWRGAAASAASTRRGGDGELGSAARVAVPEAVGRYLTAEDARARGGAVEQMEARPLPPTPRIGDERVLFAEVASPPEGVSILAAVSTGGRRGLSAQQPELRPWRAPSRVATSSASSAPTLFMLVRGRVSPAEMIDLARTKSARVKWALRTVGALLMWAGGSMLLSWLPALLSYLPLFGTVAASFAGVATTLVTLGGAVAVSTLIIAAAWARFRPRHAAALAAATAAAVAGAARLTALHQQQHAARPLGGASRGRAGRV